MLLLQEFDFEIKDRKGTKNQAVDHLSRLEDEAMRDLGEKAEIYDSFLDEHVLAASYDLIPWFIDFANYLASDIAPSYLSFYKRKNFMHDVKSTFGMRLICTRVLLMGLFFVVFRKLRC